MSYGVVQAEKMTTESGYSLGAGNASSFKNRIINGGMVLDQRNAGASVSLDNSNRYITDRFNSRIGTGTGATGIQSSTAPSGFTKSLLITIGTGASPAASELSWITQPIEGLNVADLGWGTANAKAVTVSFWARSSVTGTYAISLTNNGLNRSYVATYTIDAANTYEYKTLTIPGDTTGTWLTDTSPGIYLFFDLGSGSTRQGSAGAWTGSWLMGTSGSVKLVQTSGATFYITGVQFEVGTVATSFDFRSYGTELALCQRYYQRIGSTGAINAAVASGVNFSTATGITYCKFITTMRAAPTGSVTTASNFLLLSGGYATTGSAVTVYTMGTDSTRIDVTTAGLTTGQGSVLYIASTTDAIQLSAEL